MHLQLPYLLAAFAAIPTITALVLAPSPALKERAAVIEARAPSPTVIIDLNNDFNNPTVLSLIDQSLPPSAKRTSGIEVSWSLWSSVASVIKARATKPHAPSDPVVRVAIAINVNPNHFPCTTEGAHIVYYVFPDNSGALMTGLVDAWDTLTDNDNLCQSQVNDVLRALVPTKISLIQSLVNVEFSQKIPQEHFGSFLMMSNPVRIVLQRDTIVSRWNNFCMDVRQASTADGAVIQQYDCNDTRAQKFNRVAVTSNISPQTFVIQNYNSARCVAPIGGSTENGVGLVQVQCNTLDTSQQWKSVSPGFSNQLGANWIVNVKSGKCIDVTGWSTVAGTQLQQLDCVGGWKDYWYNTGVTFP